MTLVNNTDTPMHDIVVFVGENFKNAGSDVYAIKADTIDPAFTQLTILYRGITTPVVESVETHLFRPSIQL